jgi:C-terminal processing protease CtpA/Prc
MFGLGFEIEGGDDVDGLQPHVSSVEEYSSAANGGLQVGDFILGINGQVIDRDPMSSLSFSIMLCHLLSPSVAVSRT